MSTFIKITNEKIYEKLEKIESHILITNGKVKLNTVLSRMAITVCLICFSIIAGIVFRGVS